MDRLTIFSLFGAIAMIWRHNPRRSCCGQKNNFSNKIIVFFEYIPLYAFAECGKMAALPCLNPANPTKKARNKTLRPLITLDLGFPWALNGGGMRASNLISNPTLMACHIPRALSVAEMRINRLSRGMKRWPLSEGKLTFRTKNISATFRSTKPGHRSLPSGDRLKRAKSRGF